MAFFLLGSETGYVIVYFINSMLIKYVKKYCQLVSICINFNLIYMLNINRHIFIVIITLFGLAYCFTWENTSCKNSN